MIHNLSADEDDVISTSRYYFEFNYTETVASSISSDTRNETECALTREMGVLPSSVTNDRATHSVKPNIDPK